MPRPAVTASRPSPEVVVRIRAELTDKLLARVCRWADRLARPYLDAIGRDDPAYARMVVHDIIGDTFMGRLPWDPGRRSLATHLRTAVRWRINNDRRHSRRYPHLSLHEDDEADQCEVTTEASLRVEARHERPDVKVADRQLETRVLHALRSQADADVLRLLDAKVSGAFQRDEVMTQLGWSRGHYVNVARRLDTLILQLPVELRRAIRAATRKPTPRGPSSASTGRSQIDQSRERPRLMLGGDSSSDEDRPVMRAAA